MRRTKVFDTLPSFLISSAVLEYLLILSFFLIAVLYASAGFGGGSSYLALLSLSGLPTGAIRPIALICNLVVTGQGTVAFARAGVTPWRRALPLVVASMPAAFLGGRVQLPREQYLLLLGGLLLLAGGLMFLRPVSPADKTLSGGAAGAISIGIGIVVGFVSGVVGIGGGIFLSPILFLSYWDDARAIAATTSLFIVLNSLAGLAGQLSIGITLEWSTTIPLVASVLVGGWLGTRLSIQWLSPASIRKIAAVLILLVGARLLYANWPL